MQVDDSTVSYEADELEQAAGPARAPRLVVALSCERPLVPGSRISLGSAHEVFLGRGPRRDLTRAAGRLDVMLDDDALSRQHAVLRRVPGAWELQDLDSKNGTMVGGDYYKRTTLTDGDVIEIGTTVLVFRDACACKDDAPELADRDLDLEGDSRLPPVFRTLEVDLERRLADVALIAPSLLAVLVRGETGTGKELVARAVHELSARRGPFVAINCGALPRALVESELFGYRRGAFSDARDDREGLVRRAHGGTLFLDEVAELPPESQAALLRVLQEGEVRPLGAAEAVAVDVRVVAATHQDIHARVAEGRFREDLYSRLIGYQLSLPALRARREDLGVLVAAILSKIGRDAEQVTLQRQAARALFNYSYPLNIRELEQAIRAAVVFAGGRQIRFEHLPAAMRRHPPSTAAPPLRPEDHALRAHLHEILRETHGNVAAAARAMNKAPIQIRRWCRRFAMDLAGYRL
jgi:hypothetical protein